MTVSNTELWPYCLTKTNSLVNYDLESTIWYDNFELYGF